ncbi:MAG: hypothetical protein WAV54_08715 [Acidimicrobiales bacterium]
MKGFTYLAGAVLAVIAIGVGVSASTWNQKLYGPSWGRFTVGFPAVPQLNPPGWVVPTWYASKLGRATYEEVAVTVQEERGPWKTAEHFARLDHKLTGTVWTFSRVGNLTILTSRLSCEGPCETGQFVWSDRARSWVKVVVSYPAPTAAAWARANKRAIYRRLTPIAERLLASFQPVG